MRVFETTQIGRPTSIRREVPRRFQAETDTNPVQTVTLDVPGTIASKREGASFEVTGLRRCVLKCLSIFLKAQV